MKISHHTAYIIITFIPSIYIDNMRTISKGFTRFINTPLNVIKWQSFSELIVIINKNHVGILNLLKLMSFLQHPRIHHTAVISGSSDMRTLRINLHLDINMPAIDIYCMHIQGNTSPANHRIF